MCDEADQAQSLELHTIEIGIANRKPTMTFTGFCHFSECRQPIERGLFCDAGCRDDYEIDERRKGRQHEEKNIRCRLVLCHHHRVDGTVNYFHN